MRRLSRILTGALAAIVALSVCLIPAEMVFADPVLELPPIPTSSAPMAAPADETAPPSRRPQAIAPMPKELGTLQDYERETESDPTAGSSAGFAGAPMHQRLEANPNQPTLAQNAILGALMLGLFAMQLHAAHQHRRR